MYPCTPMPQLMETPPHEPEFARKGANPGLQLIEYIDMILDEAEEPLSRNDILRQLAAWKHGTSRETLNAALQYQMHLSLIYEGTKGIQRVRPAQGSVLETILRKRRK